MPCHTQSVLAFISLIVSLTWALELPRGLNVSDQERILEIVGLGSNSKFLSNAYPLGGYSGLEVSLGLDSIETANIAQLGDTASQRDTLYFPTITVGKGIYNNSDIFLHFTPPTKTTEISKFGASFRWGFYQALFLPINFSVVVNADTATVKEKLTTRNLGADLLLGMNLSQLSFFLGGGYATSRGDFAGGFNGLTASTLTETRQVESAHFMFGTTYNFEPFFVGLSLNRYATSVYSLKLGFLF